MRLLQSALLYAALGFGANGAAAETAADPAAAQPVATAAAPAPEALEALKLGDMRKLNFHAAPRDLPEVPLLDAADAPVSLADYRGRHVLLNFWATWCAPCRKEMPSLDRLQAAMGGDDFVVVPVATGRNSVAGIERFYTAAGVVNLPVLRDTDQALARGMSVAGLPITVLIDPEGREIARLIGDAEWDTPEAQTLLAAVLAGG